MKEGRLVLLAVCIVAGLMFGACTNGTDAATHNTASNTTVPHTAADDATCSAVNAMVEAGQHSTAAQAQAVIKAGVASDNAVLRQEATKMSADASNNDTNGFRTQLEAMAATCKSMGLGHS
jgi:hypothetical protein